MLSHILLVLSLLVLLSPSSAISPGFLSNSTLSQSSHASPSLGAARVGQLKFTVISNEAPWSARSIGAIQLFSKSLSYTSVASRKVVNIPANAFVLHGGSEAGNDVWVSADKGKTWQLAAGETIDGEPSADPNIGTSFINRAAAAVAVDSRTSNIYRVGGRLDSTTNVDDVWITTNGVKWTNNAESSNYPFNSERFYAGLVSTSKGELILVGGTFDNFRSYKSDVWMSVNQGKTWRMQTDVAQFGTRGIGVLLTSQHSDRLDGKDIVYMIGGQNEKDNSNEVWVSSDSGKVWSLLNARAPWPQRDAFNGAITADGVIIIAAGLGDREVGIQQESPLNDVWVSLDGGYSWGQCVEDAEWEDRYLQFTTLDEQGYFYVVAGRSNIGGGLQRWNDVWRSSISFNNFNDVSRVCNVAVPSCGVGLRCYPDSQTFIAADGSAVSCAACPSTAVTGNANSSSNNVISIVLAVFVILFVLSLLVLIFVLMKLRIAGAASPIPLPSAVDRWWYKGSTGSVPVGTDYVQSSETGNVKTDGLLNYQQY